MSNAAALATARAIVLDSLTKGARTSLSTLRVDLDGISRDAQDEALVAMQNDGLIVLYRNDNTASLTTADRAAALTVAGSPRHIAYKL